MTIYTCIYHHHSKSRDGTCVSSRELEASRAAVSSVVAGWREGAAAETAEAVVVAVVAAAVVAVAVVAAAAVVVVSLVAEAELGAALTAYEGLGRR